MLLLVGLGNPGSGYAKNRHNIGFMAADFIIRRHSFSSFRDRFKAECAEGTIAGHKVMVIKPQTFMNLSGDSVGQALRFFKLEADAVTVIHDDLDLAFGKLKIKTGGGNGGHNGLKSLDAHITPNYRRLRLGIGHPGEKHLVNPYVLGDFSGPEKEYLEPWLERISAEIGLVLSGDEPGFLNKMASIKGS